MRRWTASVNPYLTLLHLCEGLWGCGRFTCGQASIFRHTVLLHFAHKRAHLHSGAVFGLQAVGLQERAISIFFNFTSGQTKPEIT